MCYGICIERSIAHTPPCINSIYLQVLPNVGAGGKRGLTHCWVGAITVDHESSGIGACEHVGFETWSHIVGVQHSETLPHG